MKKCLAVIGVILLLVAGVCLAAVFIAPDDWEVTWEAEAYFYSDDAAELEPGTERSARGECTYQENRYKKIKFRSEGLLVKGTCTVRLLDESGNVIKEWKNCNESFEEELNQEMLEKLDSVEIVADDEFCEGSWKVQLYGKMNLLSKIEWLFAE